MDWWLVFLLLLGGFVLLLSLGLPVAFSFLALNLVGAFVFMGGLAGLQQVTFDMANAVTNFTLAPIPLFLLMGEIMFKSGVAFKAVGVLDRVLGGVPGRLSIIAVAASTLFSSFTGSTISNAALLGSTLYPEMRKKGYAKTMSIGPIIGSGGLAMMIPPSALAVLLGSIAQVSVARILVAGVLPGLLMAALYTLYIVIRCVLNPSLAPAYKMKKIGFAAVLTEFLLYVCPLLSVIALVLGPIYTGIATPTEAAALGCAGSAILAGVYRRLTWAVVRDSLHATARVSSMILLIVAGSAVYGQILSFSGAGEGLIGFVSSFNLSGTMLVVLMLLVLLFLGLFMDQVGMMMVTIPIFMPVVRQFEIDPVWFTVMVLIALDVGFTSPPFGLLLFIIKGIVPADVTMTDIYKAAFPFMLCNVAAMGLILAYPWVALYLPRLVR